MFSLREGTPPIAGGLPLSVQCHSLKAVSDDGSHRMWLTGRMFGGHFGLLQSRIESARPCAEVNLVNSDEIPLAKKEHLLPLLFLALPPVH